MTYEKRIGKLWIHLGFMKAFGLGLHVSKYGITIELICVYGGLEW
jgi:hypothetical protein